MSQRTADELEFRRGMVLGLTLAEVLLLLIFILILALGWRALSLQRDLAEERDKARLAEDVRAALGPLAPLLQKLRDRDASTGTVEELAIKLGRVETLEKDNVNLRKENFGLKSTLGSIRLIGSDLSKLKALDEVIAGAAKINPQDPPEVLARAMDLMRKIGPDIRDDQIEFLSELTRANPLHPLDQLAAAATKINPKDPPEALDRSLRVLEQLGANVKPEDVLPLDQQRSLTGELDRARLERDNLLHHGNGLTYPSCWIAAGGQTEYIFDITIQDEGLIMRDATPTRANDPDLQMVNGVTRNTLIGEAAFNKGTAELFKYSQQKNCRFYSIIRDRTGASSKQRYKALRSLVENHFYVLVPPDRPIARSNETTTAQPGIGGPLVPLPLR